MTTTNRDRRETEPHRGLRVQVPLEAHQLHGSTAASTRRLSRSASSRSFTIARGPWSADGHPENHSRLRHPTVVGDEALEVATELARRRDVNRIQASEHTRIEARSSLEHAVVDAKQPHPGEHSYRASDRQLTMSPNRAEYLDACERAGDPLGSAFQETPQRLGLRLGDYELHERGRVQVDGHLNARLVAALRAPRSARVSAPTSATKDPGPARRPPRC